MQFGGRNDARAIDEFAATRFRGEEEFIVVSFAFKVTPSFDAKTIVKKPVLTDTAGKTYNTSVSIIDAGSQPEYKCSFPFRVPLGTKVAR